MFKKVLLLIVSFIVHSSLAIDIESIGNKEEAQHAFNEQKKVVDEAQRKLEEAKRSEEVLQKGRDLLLKKIESGQGTKKSLENLEEQSRKVSEAYDKRQKAQAELEEAHKNLEEIEKKGKELAGSVTYTFKEYTPELTSEQKLEEYKNNLLENVATKLGSLEVLDLLDTELKTIEQKASYQEQMDFLKQFVAVTQEITDPALTDNVQIRLERAQKRLKQIEIFLASKPKARPGEIEKELHLSEKIPMDQEEAIKQYENMLTQEKAKATWAGSPISAAYEEKLQDLDREVTYYNNFYEKYGKPEIKEELKEQVQEIKILEDIAKDLNPPEPIEVPEIKQEDVSAKGAITTLVEQVEQPAAQQEKTLLAKIADYIVYPIKILQRGIVHVLEESSKTFIKLGYTLKDLGGFLKESPNIPKNMASMAQSLEESGIVTIMKKIPDDRATAYAEMLDSAIQAMKVVPQGFFVRMASKVAPPLGTFMQSTGEAAQFVARKIGQALGSSSVERFDAVIAMDRLIAQEKTKALSFEHESMTQKVKRNIMGLFTAFKEFFVQSKSSLETAAENYAKARDDYLTFIGVDPHAADLSAVNAQLAARQSDPALQIHNKQLVSALQNLAEEYAQLQKKLNFTVETFEFLTKNWQGYQFDQKASYVETYKAFFDVRDIKLAYLQEMKKNIEQLKKEFPSADEPANHLIVYNLDKVNQMLSGEMIKTIADYATALNTLDNQLQNMKKQYQEQLSPDITGNV